MGGPGTGMDGQPTPISCFQAPRPIFPAMNMATDTPSPLTGLWTPSALISVLLAGEALALVLAMTPQQVDDRWVRFGLASLTIQWIALCTLGITYVFRKRLAHMPPLVLAWICLAILLTLTLGVVTLGRGLLFGPFDTNQTSTLDFVLRMLAIALSMGVMGLSIFHSQWQSRRSAIRAKQAELESLQARVHPHFLFNTLNSVASLIRVRPDDAERVLLDLSDLFRAALSEPGWVRLEHEVDLCRRYLAIEQLRFGDRLKVSWHLSDDLENLSIPLLMLQPLVENAVAHGLDDTSGEKTIRIEITQTDKELLLIVSNPVPSSPSTQASGHRIGLPALRARLESVSGGLGRLDTEMKAGNFTARLTVPKACMPETGQATIL